MLTKKEFLALLMSNRYIGKACVFIFFLLSISWADAQSGKVVGIKDGDTVEVLFGQKTETIRLSDIDAPEKAQPFGTVARKKLSNLVFGKTVQVKALPHRDRNGRLIAEIRCQGQNVNLLMVASGLAWHFKKYSTKEVYAQAERVARRQRRGLWQDDDPIAPWEWRRLSKAERDLVRMRYPRKAA